MIDNPIYKIDKCISEMQKTFPNYSISKIRSEVVGNQTFGTSKYNGRDLNLLYDFTYVYSSLGS